MTRSRIASFFVAALLVFVGTAPAQAQEMIIGEETIGPGIELVFEGAPKDDVTPYAQNLAESKTDVHIEVLAGWSTDESVEIPEGAVRGGFVAYMHIFATITNEETGAAETHKLIPHVTLGDAQHYARNVSLPGDRDDPYTVSFEVRPPQETELAFHKSWRDAHGTPLFETQTFTYTGLDFAQIAAATRR